MKKIILASFMISSIIFTGCKSGEGGDPKMVLVNFFDAFMKKDFTTAKKYTTKDSEGMLNMIQMRMQDMPDSMLSKLYNKEDMEIGNAAITGDKAIVPVTDKRLGETIDFTLNKEEGNWRVAFDFSTLIQMAQKKMKEHGLNGMHHKMNDSLNSINGGNQGMDSTTEDEMKQAQKMMDSAHKMLDKAKDADK